MGVAVAVAAVALAGCGDGGSTTTTTAAPSTTIPVVRYDQPSTVKLVGTGFVDGSSLDGSAIFVEEEDPKFPQLGCEGQPEPVLFRLPLAGGERQLVGTGEDRLHGRILHGQGEKIAIVSGCEGSFTALWVGTETLDGHVNGLRKVAVGEVGEGKGLAPFSVSWSANGLSLVGSVNGFTGGPGRIVSIDPDSGALTTLFEADATGGVAQVGQLADGSYVVAADAKVSIRDAQGTVKGQGAGNGFELAADLQSVIAYGDEVLLLAPGAPRPVRLVPGSPGRQITSAALSPDGRAVVYNMSDADSGNEISLLTVEDAQMYKLAGPGALGRVFFTGDGTGVVFNQFRPSPDFTADVGLVRFPL